MTLAIARTPLHDPDTIEGLKSWSVLNRVAEIADVVRGFSILRTQTS